MRHLAVAGVYISSFYLAGFIHKAAPDWVFYWGLSIAMAFVWLATMDNYGGETNEYKES